MTDSPLGFGLGVYHEVVVALNFFVEALYSAGPFYNEPDQGIRLWFFGPIPNYSEVAGLVVGVCPRMKSQCQMTPCTWRAS